MSLLAVTLLPEKTRISQPIDDTITLSAFDRIEIPSGSAINQLRALNAISGSDTAALLAFCDRKHAEWIGQYVTEYLSVRQISLLPLLDQIPSGQTHLSPENGFLTHRISGQAQVSSKRAVSLLTEEFSKMLQRASAVLFSGDLPNGMERDIYARLGKLVSASHLRIALDCDYDVTSQSLAVHPFLVSQDQSELLKHHAIDQVGDLSIEAYVELAQDLIRAGARNVATALDAGDWLVVSSDGYMHLRTPKVDPVSPIGSKDAWLAITMRKLTFDGWSLGDAATAGAGAAAAQLLNPIPGQFNPEDAALFAGRVTHYERRFGGALTVPDLGATAPDKATSQSWSSVRVLARPNQDTRFNNTLLQVSAKPREDSFAISDDCIIVADGITHRAISGKYPMHSASADAANLICRIMPRLIRLQSDSDDIESLLRFGLKACNSAIHQINAHRSAAEISASDLGGAVATIILRRGNSLHFLHLGDCRALLVRGEEIVPLTRNQTTKADMLASQWKQQGMHKDEISRRKRALRNPRQHSTSNPHSDAAFGVLTGEAEALNFAEYGKVDTHDATHLIVCSDGFGLLSDDDLLALAHDKLQLSELARKFERNEHSGSIRSDDKTIIIAEL